MGPKEPADIHRGRADDCRRPERPLGRERVKHAHKDDGRRDVHRHEKKAFRDKDRRGDFRRHERDSINITCHRNTGTMVHIIKWTMMNKSL